MRGRRAIPDEVKQAKGNPGRRRLLTLERAKNGATKNDPAGEPPRAAAVVVPDYLSHDREQAIFRRVIDDYQQKRIARASDVDAYARWASYLHRWIAAKETLGDNATPFYKVKSNHGERLAMHPLMKLMLELERVLIGLEDRLGLNPAARQNIIRGLAAMPAGLGSLFGDEQNQPARDPVHDEAPSVEDVAAPSIERASALGFLQGVGKPH